MIDYSCRYFFIMFLSLIYFTSYGKQFQMCCCLLTDIDHKAVAQLTQLAQLPSVSQDSFNLASRDSY